MKLNATELACVRSKDLLITEKCDGRGELLNRSFTYNITPKPEV